MFTITIFLLITQSYSDSLKRLTNALDEAATKNTITRRLIPITFPDKYCVDYAPNNEWDWLTPYSGEYTYTHIENHLPSYKMSKCKDNSNCNNGAILQANEYGVWKFIWDPESEPQCVGSAYPNECNEWYGGRNPQITNCNDAHQKTVDNGLSQQETDRRQKCTELENEPPRYEFSEADKDEILRQFNVEREKSNQSPFIWSKALEHVAQLTADMCSNNNNGHPGYGPYGDDPVTPCINNGGGDDKCGMSGTQGTGVGNDVRYPVHDGYCEGFFYGLVSGFMQDAHRWPITNENPQEFGGYIFTEVGCAFNGCSDEGHFACNYI
eukprot:67023_1